MLSILYLLYRLLGLYSWVMLLYCLMSFVPMRNRFTELLSALCDPVLQPVRGFLQSHFRMSMLDWSPMVVFIAISLLRSLIVRLM